MELFPEPEKCDTISRQTNGTLPLRLVTFMRQLLFFLLVPLTAISQTPELENLERQLQKVDKTAARVELLNTLSNRYLAYKPERAKEYAEEALLLARELRDSTGMILALNRLGEFEESTDGYLVGDLTAQAHIAKGRALHTISLKVENVADTEYRMHLSRVKSIMPEPGRSVSVLYRAYF